MCLYDVLNDLTNLDLKHSLGRDSLPGRACVSLGVSLGLSLASGRYVLRPLGTQARSCV